MGEVNDPVMGGRSNATFSLNQADGYAVFDGHAAIVPSLKAPGFCNAETTDGLGVLSRGADLSGTSHMLLKVRHTGPGYAGYKVSFAADTLNPQFRSFKAGFQIKTPGQWEVVAVPFSDFSNDWSPYTGRCDTVDPTGKAHKCCNSTFPEVCPTEKNKHDISQLGLWAEGVEGKFHLEILWIGAANSTALDAVSPVEDTCSLYQIQGSDCGQSDLDCKYAPYAKKFEKGLEDGTCASQGYTVQKSQTTKKCLLSGPSPSLSMTSPPVLTL